MNTLDAAGVWVAEARRTLLAPTTLTVTDGEIAVVYGDPGHQHPLFSLALGGRLVPDGGVVAVDHDDSPQALQRRVALVDVPGVSEPDDVSRLRTIVGEELAMAGRPAGRRHVEDWLTAHSLWPYHQDRMEDLPTGARSVALAHLAAQRPGVEFLVLTLPERHGVDVAAWLSTARGLAAAGLGVVATASVGVARHIENQTPEIRTVPFGNAQFSEEAIDPAANSDRLGYAGLHAEEVRAEGSPS